MSDIHCVNNKNDRAVGAYWEKQFCAMAINNYGLALTPLQIGMRGSAVFKVKNLRDNIKPYNTYTLPDITVWTAPGQHHEIKHKDPTVSNEFGLEVYRFNALLSFAQETKQNVYYTIHNYALTDGKTREQKKKNKKNNPDHWVTANVLDLEAGWKRTRQGYSWVNAEKKLVDIHYWDAGYWGKLIDIWMKPKTIIIANNLFRKIPIITTNGCKPKNLHTYKVKEEMQLQLPFFNQ